MSAETEVVKVLYDYKYSDDTGQIEIKAGDVYRLLKKTNNEWWQVYDPSHADEDFFFVPAQYVKIVPLGDSDKKVSNEEDSFESHNSYSESSEEDTEVLNFKRLHNIIPKDNCGEGSDITNNRDNVTAQSLPHNTGEYVNLDKYRGAAGIKNVTSEDISRPKEKTPPPLTLAKPSRVPWELIQKTAPPLPQEERFLRAMAKDLPWDIYKDSTSGRLYYVNRETGERLWKPPRKINLNVDQSSLPTVSSSALAIEGHLGIPVEQDQVKENGSNILTHKVTHDKWKSLAGKIEHHYFRKMGSSDTHRHLPTASEVPEKDNVSQTVEPSVQDRSPASARVSNPQRPPQLTPSNSTGTLLLQTFEDVYGGYFYKTKILDVTRKKVKKSWAQIYVVLQGSNLVFYKDQKSAVQKLGPPFGKPEAVVSLQGAIIDLNPKELTSKKNTISLRATAGNIYLFHSESEKENLEWFTRMKIVANDMSASSSARRDSDAQEVKKEKVMMRSASADDSSAVNSLDRTRNMIRIRAKLFNLIARRSTQEDLYKRGIIRDSVFGSRLHELCDREQVNVPNFVHQCIAAVEAKGITHDGLYRISGNMAEIQRLRCNVDTCDSYNLYDEQWDINVLTGALKLFFRELKEPVFTFRMHDRFIEAIKIESQKERLSAFKYAVSDLPRCNHATLKELFQHLLRVIDASHRNRMQYQNIAIVFGPTLLWQPGSLEVQATQAVYQNKIVEFVLQEYSDLFY